MSESHELRQLTGVEQAYLDRLMSTESAGRRDVTLQIASAFAQTVDDDGSIRLHPQVNVMAPVHKRIPVEGEGLDATVCRFTSSCTSSRGECTS